MIVRYYHLNGRTADRGPSELGPLPPFVRGIGLKVEEPRSNNTTSSELSSGRGAARKSCNGGEPETLTDRRSPLHCMELPLFFLVYTLLEREKHLN